MSQTFCRETLQENTVAQLRNWAHTLQIKIPGYVRKNDLIQKILDATTTTAITTLAGKRPRSQPGLLEGKEQPALKRPRHHLAKPGFITQAALKIQRFFRRYVRGFVNREDFLNLEPFTKSPLFRHVVDVNQVYRFYPQDLWRYFQENGLLRNPYTHVDFNVIELRRLQKMLKKIDPTFCRDLVAEREDLRRNALEAMNLEHNVQFFNDMLRDTIIGSLQLYMNDGTAFEMNTNDLMIFIDLWSMQEASVNNYLYTLLHLSRSSAIALIYDLVNLRFFTGTNPGYTMQFRLYADLVITTVENLFLYFSALSPQDHPFLLAHNIWNTVIQETLRHQLAPAVAVMVPHVNPLDQPHPVALLMQNIPQPPPLIRQGAVDMAANLDLDDYDSEDDDSEDEDDEDDDDEDEEIAPPPPPPPAAAL
jgi:hypothetical protein